MNRVKPSSCVFDKIFISVLDRRRLGFSNIGDIL